MKARAPGKLMLAGEYAVLHGAPALVMAVDRRAVASVRPEGVAGVALPPEVTATLALAAREGVLSRAYPDVTLDVTALAGDGGRKLGLGSSAAGCVAALALCLAREGRALDRRALASLARRGHREAQGGGSGVDVVASALGGVVRVALPDGLAAEAAVEARTWPASIPWVVLWTGTPARTSEMLARVDALFARDRGAAVACMEGIAGATARLERALASGDPADACAAVREHARWMDDLGRRAGAAVVTDAMRQVAAAVEPLGVALKPSGAGGGDVALAVGHDLEALTRAVDEAARWGFTRVALAVDPDGARVTEGE